MIVVVSACLCTPMLSMSPVPKILSHFFLSHILFQTPSECSRMCSFCLASALCKNIQIIHSSAPEWSCRTSPKAQIRAQELGAGSPGSCGINGTVVGLQNGGHSQKCHI